MMRTAVLFLLMLTAWLVAIPRARADPRRVLVELAPANDDLARVAGIRLGAELSAAGFDVTTVDGDSDVRATLVVRDGRIRLFLELPGGDTVVVRADDVPEGEAAATLALRAVERLSAVFSMPEVSAPPSPRVAPEKPIDPLPASSARAISPKVEPRRQSTPMGLFQHRHVIAGAAFTWDGGALAVAPTLGFGLGVGRGIFLRGSFWGPSSTRTFESIAGAVDVSVLGARIEIGRAWSIHPRLEIGPTLGVGFARYAIDGRAAAGYSSRSAAHAVFVAHASGFLAWRIKQPLYALFEVGAAFSLPSVGISLAETEVAEFGTPEFRSTVGLGFTF